MQHYEGEGDSRTKKQERNRVVKKITQAKAKGDEEREKGAEEVVCREVHKDQETDHEAGQPKQPSERSGLC
jgi:hypothetical protein